MAQIEGQAVIEGVLLPFFSARVDLWCSAFPPRIALLRNENIDLEKGEKRFGGWPPL